MAEADRKTKLQIIRMLWANIYDLLAYAKGMSRKTLPDIERDLDVTEYYCRPYADCDDDELYAADMLSEIRKIKAKTDGGCDGMSITEILSWGGGGLLLLLTLVEITPIKVNPWSAIAKALGRAINTDVMKKLETVEENQKQTQQRLEQHIHTDNERNANSQRERILQFNTELMRNEDHTREDFIEILAVIDCYEKYCKEHPDYPNNRAVHAVANIERVYDERLLKNDFFKGEVQVKP